MYKKINVYLNNKYICSTTSYSTIATLRNRIRSDKRIFVHSIPDKIIDVCDYDKLTLKYDK